MYAQAEEIDYPEAQVAEYEREHEMVAAAESHAPPAMLAQMREFDRAVERRELR